MKRVLIIDALNMFLRAYIVDPSLSTNGEPIGGFKGSLEDCSETCADDKAKRDCNRVGWTQWLAKAP